MALREIRYELSFPDGRYDCHVLQFEPRRITLVPPPGEPPDWAALSFHQCPNCPLPPDARPHCPAAVAMAPLARTSSQLVSFQTVHVRVVAPERIVMRETSAQQAVSALLGLVLATSGCPRLAFLRPMARFHLPVADEVETLYRVTTMHLLRQYFRERAGLPATQGFDELVAAYDQLQVVNAHLAMRVRAACERDAVLNAVVLLDVLAKTVPFSLEGRLDDLRPLFEED